MEIDIQIRGNLPLSFSVHFLLFSIGYSSKNHNTKNFPARSNQVFSRFSLVCESVLPRNVVKTLLFFTFFQFRFRQPCTVSFIFHAHSGEKALYTGTAMPVHILVQICRNSIFYGMRMENNTQHAWYRSPVLGV